MYQRYLIKYIVDKKVEPGRIFCGFGYRLVFGTNRDDAQNNFANEVNGIKHCIHERRKLSGLSGLLEVRVSSIQPIPYFHEGKA